MAELTLRKVVKRYGATEVIHGLDLDIKRGEFVVFVGPSGCGKSTLLGMIAGLEEITDGEFRMDQQRVNETPPANQFVAGFIGSPKMNFIDARLTGRDAETITVTAPGGVEEQSMVVQVVGQSPIKRGDTVHLQLPLDHCHAFSSNGLSLTH